jgi:signal transduction histidine kinase/ActR/RegA family two-component response regulator
VTSLRPSAETAECGILVLAPFGRDAQLACSVLAAAGMQAEPCSDGDVVRRLARKGIGALVLTEEAAAADVGALTALVERQAAWSDLPVIVFASSDPSSLAGRELLEQLRPLGNVTILERPVHRNTLISAAKAALRARNRQYQMRDLLAEHKRGLSMRDQFLAMLGHELRNPLGAVQNTLHLIAMGRQNESDEQGVRVEPRHVALIARQVGNLSRLVDDLLDVSRVTSGKIVLKREVVDLAELVSRCVESLGSAAHIHGLSLEHDAARGVVVFGDPTRLEQVVTNLLANAIKYTPPHGNVHVAVGTDGNHAVITVADTGAGLTEEMLERVFELFSQADRTLERAEGGLGIGLTLVRAIVRQHGGEVTARSAGPGQGSTFDVRLALARQPATSSASTRLRARQPPAHALRVLVVEDHADNRESLVFLLQQLGHQAQGAEDGMRALPLLASGHFDLAFVDIGLPGMDGYEVARRARANGAPNVHLVALTGYGQPEDRERSRTAGFDDHIAKPLDLATLDAVLSRVGSVRS